MLMRALVGLSVSLCCSLSAIAESAMPDPPKTSPAPTGISLTVTAPAHLHVPKSDELKNKPFPLQVVARLSNETDHPISWTVTPESMHFWRLTNSDSSIVDCGHLLKPREKFISGVVVTIPPHQSISTEPLVGIAPEKLRSSSKYQLHYTFCGIEGHSEIATD
jgi:hypothetical protein